MANGAELSTPVNNPIVLRAPSLVTVDDIARKLNAISAKNMDILPLTAQPRHTTTPINKRQKKRARPQPETPKRPRQ